MSMPLTIITSVPRTPGTVGDLQRLADLSSEVDNLSRVLLRWQIPGGNGETVSDISITAKPGQGQLLGGMLDRIAELQVAASKDTFFCEAAALVDRTARHLLSLVPGSVHALFHVVTEYGQERLHYGSLGGIGSQIGCFLGAAVPSFVGQLSQSLPQDWVPAFVAEQTGLGLASGLSLRRAAIEEHLAAKLRGDKKPVPENYGTVEAMIAALTPENGVFSPILEVTADAVILGARWAAYPIVPPYDSVPA